MRSPILTTLALTALPSLLNAQAWEQNLAAGTTDNRLPSGLGVTPTVIAYGQPRFDPYLNPLIEDIVRVFEKQGSSFVEVAALQSSLTPASSASYGIAIALEDDLLFVGDPAGGGGGVVHIYRRGATEWQLELVLQPSVPNDFFLGGFGLALDYQNGRLAVAAPGSNTSQGQIEDGAVFVFEEVAGLWTQTQLLTHPVPNFFTGFGRGLDLDGDRMIIGSPGDFPPAGTSGTAFVYDHDGSQFVQSATLVPSIPENAGFGWDVAIEGDVAAASSPGAVIVSHGDGRVHLFKEGAQGWQPDDIVENHGTEFHIANRFGEDIQLEGGALFAISRMSASVLRFEPGPNGWEHVERYTTSAGISWPRVAEVRVCANGSQVLVSDFEGAVLFERDKPATLEFNCDGVPIHNGTFSFPILLDTRGEQSFSESELEFYVAHAVNLGPGVLFYGFNSTEVPFGPGGGNLCISGPVFRAAFGQQVQTPQVHTQVTLDLHAPPVSGGPGSFGPGTTIYAQYWARLVGGGSHLSNSLEMVFAP